MLKSEILELVKELEDGADIDEIILNQGFAKPISDLEGFKSLLASNEGIAGYYQSALDSGIGKGVAKFKENFNKNDLPKLIEDGIKAKSQEGKSEQEIKLEQALAEIEQMKADKQRSDMSNKYMKVLGEKGLSTDLIDFILGADDDTTTANIEKISNIINASVTNGVKGKLGDTAYVPPENNNVNTMEQQLNSLMGIV